MIWLVPTALGLCLAWLIWGLICNERTYRQRLEIINALWGEGWPDYYRVSYGQHMRALQLFRDPYDLYSPALVRRVKLARLAK